MRILFFSSIFWHPILAIVAADERFSAACTSPNYRIIRTQLAGRKRYIQLEDFQEYDTCKKEEMEYLNKEHDKKVSRKEFEIEHLNQLHDEEIIRKKIEIDTLKQQILNKEPKNLAEHIKCDHKNRETKDNCISRLQNLLQGFIDVHQELPIGNDETPNEQNKRLKQLIITARQKSDFYNKLYNRCNSNILMNQRENKLAGDYVKCRSDLLVCEKKIADRSCDVRDRTPTVNPNGSFLENATPKSGKGATPAKPRGMQTKATLAQDDVYDESWLYKSGSEVILYFQNFFEKFKKNGAGKIVKRSWAEGPNFVRRFLTMSFLRAFECFLVKRFTVFFT